MGILSWIVVGLIAGWLAGKVMSSGGYGLMGDIIVGVLGGLLGDYLAILFPAFQKRHVGDQRGVDPGRLHWSGIAARRDAPVAWWS